MGGPVNQEQQPMQSAGAVQKKTPTTHIEELSSDESDSDDSSSDEDRDDEQMKDTIEATPNPAQPQVVPDKSTEVDLAALAGSDYANFQFKDEKLARLLNDVKSQIVFTKKDKIKQMSEEIKALMYAHQSAYRRMTEYLKGREWFSFVGQASTVLMKQF